jgi:hypothetical protein
VIGSAVVVRMTWDLKTAIKLKLFLPHINKQYPCQLLFIRVYILRTDCVEELGIR